LPYTAGSTSTKDAVNAAIAQINANDKGLPNVIFLVTDGNPNPTTSENPCAAAYAPTITAELQALGATVVLVGVGPGDPVVPLWQRSEPRHPGIGLDVGGPRSHPLEYGRLPLQVR
jgi:hypothetical protein